MTAKSQHLGTVGILPGTVQVVVSGTSGLRPDGTRPVDFADEVRQAWNNVREALLCAGAELSDIVQVRTWLTDAENVGTYGMLHNELIGPKPSYVLVVVPQLARPSIRVQIDVVAVVRSTACHQDG